MHGLKWIRRVAGTLLFMVGLVSLLLPMVPGWLLIGLGLYLLSVDSPGMQHRIGAVRARYAFIDRLFVPLDKLYARSNQPTDETSQKEE